MTAHHRTERKPETAVRRETFLVWFNGSRCIESALPLSIRYGCISRGGPRSPGASKIGRLHPYRSDRLVICSYRPAVRRRIQGLRTRGCSISLLALFSGLAGHAAPLDKTGPASRAAGSPRIATWRCPPTTHWRERAGQEVYTAVSLDEHGPPITVATHQGRCGTVGAEWNVPVALPQGHGVANQVRTGKVLPRPGVPLTINLA